MKNLNKLTATTAAIVALTAGVAACGGPKEKASLVGVSIGHVDLSKGTETSAISKAPVSAERKARAIQARLNAGKEVLGATVEFGYKIPGHAGQIPEHPGVAFIENPIKLSDGVYAYKAGEGDDGVQVRALKYPGKLVAVPSPEGQDRSREITADLAGVYSEFPVGEPGNETTGRFYVISANQVPGNHYNGTTLSAGEPVFEACHPVAGCG